MTTASTLLKVSAVALVAAAMAACTPRTPATTGAGTDTAANNPSYPSAPTGPVSGGNVPPAAGSEQDFVVNVGDRVYFDLDQYQINPAAYSRLDGQAQWLQRYPNVRIRIEGNADERGTREYNLALGARRAEALRTYMIERGVNAGRIDTISYGKERPIAAGSGEESWARNRNAHTAIVSGATR